MKLHILYFALFLAPGLFFTACQSSENSKNQTNEQLIDQFAQLHWTLETDGGHYKKFKAEDKGFTNVAKYIFTYEDGQLKEVYHKIGDLKEGVEQRWHPNGEKQLSAFFKNGKQEGEVTIWFENGNLASKIFYQKGIKNGKATYWFANGNKEKEGTYKNDQLHGEGKIWAENGTLKQRVIFENGQVVEQLPLE